jgi:AcrR family transcriptional regulator
MTTTIEPAWCRELLHPEDESGKRRSLILQSAFDNIAETGFEGLRTRAVAARTGINIATLHYYFPSKQELIEALARFIGAKFVTLHGPEPAPSGLPALDRLRQEFADGRYYVQQQPSMLLVIQEFALRSRRDPEVQAVFQQMQGHWRHGIEEMVRAGLEDGTFRQDVDAEEMRALLMAIFSGASAALDVREFDVLERYTIDWILSESAKRKLEAIRGEKQ